MVMVQDVGATFSRRPVDSAIRGRMPRNLGRMSWTAPVGFDTSVETPSGQQYILIYIYNLFSLNNIFTEWVLLPGNSPLFENVLLACVG